jgi:hypothetical protein
MKKISSLLIICSTILFFASCKKDSGSGGSNYYIKANIGGTEKTFTSTPLVIKFDQTGAYSISLSAGAGGSSLESLGLQIEQSSGPITAGTYSDDGNSDAVVGGAYNPGSTDVSDIYGAGLQISSTAPLKVTISEISDTKVSGTFSGEFFDNSGTGSNSLMITNGEFNLPIQ